MEETQWLIYLLQCHYDKNHQIRAPRFPYHLINKMTTCPFNACYHVPLVKISHHISSSHGSVLLWMKTEIKICRNRPATPLVWGTVNYFLEHKSNLVSGMCAPKSLRYTLEDSCFFFLPMDSFIFFPPDVVIGR
ncbi:unnamed protein product [Nyctereutes procyonoides]|uniref:(raccoon dog) hypothetical protein n=1 Tax=Nyctereutes procyonoides TaxID=34880 RepID=A0A811ZNP3_NYCPR|nr:unnamed protein product [Nyctereutes procyonoides]